MWTQYGAEPDKALAVRLALHEVFNSSVCMLYRWDLCQFTRVSHTHTHTHTLAGPETPLCPPLDDKNRTLRIIAPLKLRGAFFCAFFPTCILTHTVSSHQHPLTHIHTLDGITSTTTEKSFNWKNLQLQSGGKKEKRVEETKWSSKLSGPLWSEGPVD